MKNRYKLAILILVILTLFVFMLVLNYNTALVSDDYIYQFVFENRMPTTQTKRLSNIFELFPSMANHWRLWGGRVTVHFLLQLCFLIGINFFNIINSIMFIILGYLIYKHINNTKEIKLTTLISIYATIFLFTPQPGATLLWKSGSANYMWASVLFLCMTLIYKKHFDNKNNIKNTTSNLILLLLFGLFIGCTSENGGIALIITLILFIITYKIKYNKIPYWAYSGLIGTIISYILLLISPGNYIRANEMYPGVEYKFNNLIEYTLKITYLSYEYIGLIIITAIITTIIVINKQKLIKEYIEKYSIQIIFLLFSTISIYSLILSPAYPERSWMFSFIYLIVVIYYNIEHLKELKQYSTLSNKISISLMIILSFISIRTYYLANNDLITTKRIADDHIEIIKEEINDGNLDVVVHTFPYATGKYNAFMANGYLTSNEKSWTNQWVAKYYGLNSIKAQS